MGKALVIKGADFSANGIPADLVRLNWVSSAHENQSFNSGYRQSKELRVEVDFTIDESYFNAPRTVINYLFGCEGTGDVFSLGWLYNGTNVNGNVYGYLNNESGGKITLLKSNYIQSAGRHTMRLDVSGLYVDGNMIATPSQTVVTGGQVRDLFMMGINGGPSVKYCVLRIHEVKVYENYQNEAPSSIFYPVKKKDGTVCMYDEVKDAYIMTTDGEQPLFGE